VSVVDDAYVEAVLLRVEQVPPGRVTTYGDLADAVGRGGPRLAGRVMSQYGAAVPWWRVVRADGSTPDFLRDSAARHWRAEGTPLLERPDGSTRVDMRRAVVHLAVDPDAGVP
jgi:alkylated DNA nucleotide flippase Atl1